MPVRRSRGVRSSIRRAAKAPYRRARRRLAGLKGFQVSSVGRSRSASDPGFTRAGNVVRAVGSIADLATGSGGVLAGAADRIAQIGFRNKKGRRYGSGHLAGKLAGKKATRPSLWKKCEREGIITKAEVKGNLKDPDCIYLGYTPFSASDAGLMVLRAIIRKLLKKAISFNPVTVETPIDYSVGGYSGAQLTFRLWRERLDGVIDNYFTYDSVSTSTILTVSNALEEAFLNEFAQNTADGDAYNQNRLYKITLDEWTSVAGLATAYRKLGELNIANMKVHLTAIGTMQVQNRTINDAGDDDAGDVNNVPLVGKMYTFKGALPITQVPRPELTTLSGLFTMRAGEVVSNNQVDNWDEPPDKSNFMNCSRVRKVAMNPGDVKKDRVTFTRSMRIRDFMDMVKERRYASRFTASRLYKTGDCHMIALEKSLNFGLPIDVVYTYDIKIGCMVTTWEKIPTMCPVYYGEVNDV